MAKRGEKPRSGRRPSFWPSICYCARQMEPISGPAVGSSGRDGGGTCRGLRVHSDVGQRAHGPGTRRFAATAWPEQRKSRAHEHGTGSMRSETYRTRETVGEFEFEDDIMAQVLRNGRPSKPPFLSAALPESDQVLFGSIRSVNSRLQLDARSVPHVGQPV